MAQWSVMFNSGTKRRSTTGRLINARTKEEAIKKVKKNYNNVDIISVKRI